MSQENRSGNGFQGPCRLWWVLRAGVKRKQISRSINHARPGEFQSGMRDERTFLLLALGFQQMWLQPRVNGAAPGVRLLHVCGCSMFEVAPCCGAAP